MGKMLEFKDDNAQKVAAGEARLLDALAAINSDLRLKAAVKNVVQVLLDQFRCEEANVILVDLRYFVLSTYSSSNRTSEGIRTISNKCTEQMIGWRSSNTKPVLVNDLENDMEFSSAIGSCFDSRPKNLISAPLFAGGEYFGMIQAINSMNADGFSQDDLDTLAVLAGHVAQTLRNSWILEEAIRGSREAKSLYEVGIALSSSLDLDELLQKILDNLSRVVACDSAVIYLVNPRTGNIEQIVGKGVPEVVEDKLHLKIGQGVTGRVVATGKGVIISDVSSDPDYIAFRPQTKSEMAVPLKVGDSVIGAFNLESDWAQAYSEHDLELLNAFASLAAITIERARLHHERMSSRKIVDELAIARRIQMTFLPSQDPTIPGFDISGINTPSADVGGDYYDFIPIVDNQLGVAIGDVSGKGVPAALIMAAFRASLKAEIRNNFAIRAILMKVNNLLFESVERDNYVTAIYSVLDIKNKVLTFSNAGHNPPILRKSNGQVEYLREGGLALGTFANSAYEERPISLSPGDILLFYTDGVTEAKNDADEEFGVARLLNCLEESKDRTSKEIIKYIVDCANSFASRQKEMDDLTMVIIKML
jgi:sigma-B regulation protein RsbU (phosphoserine phosphatase)